MFCVFRLGRVAALGVLLIGLCRADAGLFRVATFNLENYLDESMASRSAKSPEAKAKVRQSICALKPDVLAVQEIGGLAALHQLRAALKADGLDLPHWEHVTGTDTNIQVALLSRFPFTARRPHTNESFLLGGRRFHVNRGFAEVEVQVNSRCSFTLIAAHLKSRRPVGQADEADLRLEEAKLLREKIDDCFVANPGVNLVVLGDLNDTMNSASLKAIIGRGKHKLVDTRPAERVPDWIANASGPAGPKSVTWTYFFEKEDDYSRIDYILLSPALARQWVTNQTYLLAMPDWGQASDHRPLVAAFESEQ
jgi:endonuclease/exonuclease/phosphatase family metal-dependent hydrolase